MKELYQKINETIESFNKNATDQIEKGNKSAGVRARKNALDLMNMLKEFRKESVKYEPEK